MRRDGDRCNGGADSYDARLMRRPVNDGARPLEGWPSGLRRTPGKRVGVKAPRGFESPSLRQTPPCPTSSGSQASTRIRPRASAYISTNDKFALPAVLATLACRECAGARARARVARNITTKRVDSFIEALKDAGGSAGNSTLRQMLNWDEKSYWRIQGHLIKTGRIVAGRGRGGSVRFTEAQATESGTEPTQATIPTESVTTIQNEKALYPLLKEAIEGKWIKRFALDDVMVEETHSRGSKDTGGTFTRPDITAAGIRRYVYLPKRLEIVTFEVKPAEAISIMGVLEAIAHREASHRAYVLYATPRASFEEASEGERILELAQKYGVGVMLTEKADDVETWEVLLDAVRHEPDPARLDRFLNDLPREEMKRKLSKWKE